jgi:putative colanic acid biosynthesis acetyltransferase WcaF
MFELRLFEKKEISKIHWLKIATWYLINNIIIYSFIPSSSIRIFLLRMFGASIGKNVVLRPYINVKYAWKLEVGENSWIGARVWIDNISDVKIGKNCCISQDVYFCTGNHNYKKKKFDLINEAIIINDNSWIGAKSVLCPGVNLKKKSIVKINTTVKKSY